MSRSLEEQKAGRCVHFNGVQHGICEAGVSYDSVRVDGCGLPCLKLGKGGESLQCDKRRWRTKEEIAEEMRQFEERKAILFAGLAAVVEDAEAKGFGKGHGGNGEVPCPVCDSGTIQYSVAGYNGHRHAKCSTEGCVAFME